MHREKKKMKYNSIIRREKLLQGLLEKPKDYKRTHFYQYTEKKYRFLFINPYLSDKNVEL